MGRIVALVFFGVLVLGACSGDTEPAPTSTTTTTLPPSLATLEEHRVLWDESGIGDYRVVFEVRNLNGMGGSPDDGVFDVTVRSGETISCEMTKGWNGAEGTCPAAWGPGGLTPVAALFSRILSWSSVDPSFVSVTYSSSFGFPWYIGYDDPGFVDEEYSIRVRTLDALPEQ